MVAWTKMGNPDCVCCVPPGPCAQICVTARDGCTVALISGASEILTQGSTVTGPCTTDATGRCCNVGASGAYSVLVSAPGYFSKTLTGTAVCPPPPHPVTYGPNYPATWADDATIGTGVWSNPGNAGASDSTYATATSTGNTPTHYLKGTNPGFAMATDGTELVLGFGVRVGVKATAAATDHDVRLVVGGTIGSTNLALGTSISTGATGTIDYGGPTNMWGFGTGGITAAQANAAGLGLVLSAKAPGSGGAGATFVQAPAGTFNNSSAPSNSFGAPTTAGNFLVAVISASSGTISLAGWRAGPTTTGGSGDKLAVFTLANAASTTTVTGSLTTSTRWTMQIAEYSGLGASPTAGATNTGTTTSGAATAAAGDLVIAGLANSIAVTFSGPGGGFTLQSQASTTSDSSALLWQVAGSGGSLTASTSGGTANVGVIAAFTPAGGPTTISVDYARMLLYTTRTTYELDVSLVPTTTPVYLGAASCCPILTNAGFVDCPLAGAVATLSPGGATATSASDGSFPIIHLAPGPYTWSLAAINFTTLTGSFTVPSQCGTYVPGGFGIAARMLPTGDRFCFGPDFSGAPCIDAPPGAVTVTLPNSGQWSNGASGWAGSYTVGYTGTPWQWRACVPNARGLPDVFGNLYLQITWDLGYPSDGFYSANLRCASGSGRLTVRSSGAADCSVFTGGPTSVGAGGAFGGPYLGTTACPIAATLDPSNSFGLRSMVNE